MSKLTLDQMHDALDNDPKCLLVDVRSRAEYDEGHIPGAGCMPCEEICDCLYDEALSQAGLDAIANLKGMEMADDASIIILYCADGGLAQKACQHMEALAYCNVFEGVSLERWDDEVVSTLEEAERALADAEEDEWDDCGCGDDGCGCGHDHAHEHASDLRASTVHDDEEPEAEYVDEEDPFTFATISSKFDWSELDDIDWDDESDWIEDEEDE